MLGHDSFLPTDKSREYTPLPGVCSAIFSKLVFEGLREGRLSYIVFNFVLGMMLNEWSHHQFPPIHNRTTLLSRSKHTQLAYVTISEKYNPRSLQKWNSSPWGPPEQRSPKIKYSTAIQWADPSRVPASKPKPTYHSRRQSFIASLLQIIYLKITTISKPILYNNYEEMCSTLTEKWSSE